MSWGNMRALWNSDPKKVKQYGVRDDTSKDSVSVKGSRGQKIQYARQPQDTDSDWQQKKLKLSKEYDIESQTAGSTQAVADMEQSNMHEQFENAVDATKKAALRKLRERAMKKQLQKNEQT